MHAKLNVHVLETSMVSNQKKLLNGMGFLQKQFFWKIIVQIWAFFSAWPFLCEEGASG